MKQTAVEWLINELYEKFEMRGDGLLYDEILDQAKEMEKKQAIEFTEWCLSELLNGSEPKAETMQGLLEIFKNK